MKLIVKLYRVTTIPTEEFVAQALGMERDTELTGTEMATKIREKYRPAPPRFKIFYPTDTSFRKTVIGMEAMSFDVREADVPMAGLVMADPVEAKDVDRIDGAIESELNRMNMGTEFQNFEWRVEYQLSGN